MIQHQSEIIRTKRIINRRISVLIIVVIYEIYIMSTSEQALSDTARCLEYVFYKNKITLKEFEYQKHP